MKQILLKGESPGYAPEPQPPEAHLFNLSPAKTARTLAIVAAFIVCCSIGGAVLQRLFLIDNSLINFFSRIFNVGLEANIPTLFSSGILIIASALAGMIYKIVAANSAETRFKYYWLLISLLFLFLSLDEALSIHEELNKLSTMIDTSSFLLYAWTIPYSILFITGLLLLRGFLNHLPPRTKRIFIISMIIFVSGALGLEFLEGYVVEKYGVGNVYDVILFTLEESMEMGGVILFIYGLMDYIAQATASIRISHVYKL